MRPVQIVCLCLLLLAAPCRLAAQTAAGGVESAADGPKAVLELFTSQGCSSCPPADALFKSYSARTDVIALTYNVDYWDYLGWKDTLASRKNSDRQRAYARSRGDGMVYTPQMVINGAAHVKGSDRTAIDKAIARSAATFASARVPVRVTGDKGQLVIEIGDAKPGAAPSGANASATVWLAMVQKRAEVAVRQGENHDRTLSYTNSVRDITPIGMWNGKSMTIRLERQAVQRPDGEACAVLLQHAPGGAIIGAAWLGDW